MLSGKCPHCGGEVKDGVCPYCDSDLRDERDKDKEKLYGMVINARLDREAAAKKQKKQKTAAVILSVCFGVFVLGVFIFNPLTRLLYNGSRYNAANIAARAKSSAYVTDKNSSAALSENDITEESADKKELYSQKGRWASGVYQMGTDIPFGTYLLMYDGALEGYPDFPVGLYEDAQTSDDKNLTADTWSMCSRYITVRDEGYLDISWSILYDIQKNDVKNDPYDHCGMFLVGRDMEAGTYELTFDSRFEERDSHHSYGSYTVYSDVDIVAPVVREQGKFSEGVTVTVSDGEFLKLDECMIRDPSKPVETALPTEPAADKTASYKNAVYARKGRWEDGLYKVGEDIPKGTYLLMFKGMSGVRGSFPISLFSGKETSDSSRLNSNDSVWSEYSRYVTLNDEGYFNASSCMIYDPEKNDIINDPHYHSGMFLAGRDIEAGTYELAFDRAYEDTDKAHAYGSYAVYTDVDLLDPVIRQQGKFEEGLTVTVNEGEYLGLHSCVIKN